MWRQISRENKAGGRAAINNVSLLILIFALLACSLFIYRDYVFGSHLLVFNDIGSDTMQQYVMHYQSIINHIRDGNWSFWDFSNGFGTSFFQLNLFDPSLDLLYLLGVLAGPERLLYDLVYLQIFRILAAGAACYLYLSCFGFGEGGKLTAAFSYALCGFLMVWGQHYQFGLVMTYFPMLLFLVERALKKRFSFGLCVMSCLQIVYSYYLGYMVFATTGIYLILRLFAEEGRTVREKISCFARQIGQMLLGICMGCFALLPSAYIVFGVSARMEQKAGLMERLLSALRPYPMSYYKLLILKFFSGHLNGRNADYNGYLNYYEDPNVFFGTLFLIVAVQFVCLLLSRKETKRFRAAGWTALVLSVLAFALPLGGIAYNGFASYPTFRFTFVFMPFFALMTAFVVDRLLVRREISLPGLMASVLLIAGGYGWRMTAQIDRQFAGTLLFTGIAMAGCLLALRYLGKNRGRAAVLILFGVLLAWNLVKEGRASVVDRVTVEKQSAYFDELYSGDIKEALAYLRETDPSFYRVEKDFWSATYCMDSLAQNYRGVSTYNSTLNSHLLELISGYFPELFYENESHIMFSQCARQAELAELFGIRYLLSRDLSGNLEGYTLLAQFGEVAVYRLDAGSGFGRFYSGAIAPEAFARLAGEERPAEVLNRVLVLPDGGKEETEEQGSGTVEMADTRRDSELSGTVSCTAEGYVMLPIPFEGGWKCRLDGEPAELLQADIGFTAFAVPAGEHIFELKYTPPLLREGVWLSVSGWSAAFLCAVLPLLLRKVFPENHRQDRGNSQNI